MPDIDAQELKPCPFCGGSLTIREGANPYGRCDTVGCWMSDRALAVVADDPKQVAAWNRRALSPSGDDRGEPVAWQHRTRAIRDDNSYSPWGSWLDGRAPDFKTRRYEAEERPLYTATHPNPDRLLCGDGWVFWSPDSGEEYSPSHPVESGECEDAERIRRSTNQEDTLGSAMRQLLARSHTTTPDRIAELEKALEALKNASGLLDTPLARRRHKNDPFYDDVVASIRAVLDARRAKGGE